MFIGVFEHNIEGKNRLSLPSHFREELGKKLIYKYCNSEYPSIQIYDYDYFQQNAPVVEGIVTEAKMRLAYAQKFVEAYEGEVDSVGRVLLKNRVLDKAGITKKCLIIGFGSYIEVMSAENYEKMLLEMDEKAKQQEAAAKSEETLKNDLIASGAYLDKGNTVG